MVDVLMASSILSILVASFVRLSNDEEEEEAEEGKAAGESTGALAVPKEGCGDPMKGAALQV
jgi:hypothetical protein